MLIKNSFPSEHEERIYSGSKKARYGISIGDSYLQLPWKKHGYTQYSVLDTRTQLRLCDSFYLPVYFVKREYEEYETKKEVYTKKQAEAQAAEDLEEFLEKLIEKGVLILEKHVMIRAGKNKYTVSGTITVIESTFRYAVNGEHLPDAGDEGNVGNESE